MVVVRLPGLHSEMELGERHQNVRTGNTGQWKRCGKVPGRVRSAEEQAHGPLVSRWHWEAVLLGFLCGGM